MSTSSNKQQEKGKDRMGDAGKRKEMVYVEGRCVKGAYAIVRKSGLYVCDRIVRESARDVYACVYVCVVWRPKCMCSVCMCMCACVCV